MLSLITYNITLNLFFSKFYQFICNKPDFSSYNNLNTVFTRTDDSCNSSRFDLFLIYLILIFNLQTKSRNAAVNSFPKDGRNCVIGLQSITVLKSVWNLPASIGSLYLMFWKRQIILWFLLIQNIQNLKKEIRPTERMRNGFATCSCVKWSNSLRKTKQALHNFYGIIISRQSISNYCKSAALCIKPFVDHYDYGTGSVFTADETYIKIRGVKAYVWFIMDTAKRSVIGYRISDNRGVGPCILAMRMAFRNLKELPKTCPASGSFLYSLANRRSWIFKTGPQPKRSNCALFLPSGEDGFGRCPKPSESLTLSISTVFKVHLILFFMLTFFIHHLTLSIGLIIIITLLTLCHNISTILFMKYSRPFTYTLQNWNNRFSFFRKRVFYSWRDFIILCSFHKIITNKLL